jgi:hypothetical protein
MSAGNARVEDAQEEAQMYQSGYSGPEVLIALSLNSGVVIPIGPTPYLWLDYSQVTGTLNQMRVAWPGRKTNVCLAWEGVNEDVENGPCEHWRVLIVAIREIIPFEPLIRAASSEEQFALHQSLDYARRGFLEEPLW